MIKIGVITDEVSQDLREALRWAREHNLDYIDLRDVNGENIAELPEEEIPELAALVSESGLPLLTICPQLFRAQLNGSDVRRLLSQPALVQSDESQYAEQIRLLQHSLDLARRLGAPYIRTFAFWREFEPGEAWTDLLAAFRLPVQLAAEAGKTLLLENEAESYAVTGSEAARLIEAVGSRNLQAIWDPANAFGSPERPYPEGYLALRPHIRVIHAKDATKEGFTVPGQGEIDWEGQLKALSEDCFDGFISVEPRWAPPGETIAQVSARILTYLRGKISG